MASALFVLIIGLGAFVAGVGYIRKAHAMRFFRSTSGKVIAREVVAVPGANTREGVYGKGGGYAPSVRYRYSVEGRELESAKLRYAPQGRKRSIAEADLALIPDDVTVWYDPRKPEEAYLERHTPALGYFFVALGGVFMMGAVAYFAAR